MKISAGVGALLLGPSGTGKSHMLLSALEHYGSGAIVLAPGMDEVQSYAPLFSSMEEVKWNEDGSVVIPDSPYVAVPVDDESFFPDLANVKDRGKPEGLSKAIVALRALAEIQRTERRYKVLGVDTFTGINDLSINSALKKCGLTEPPAARSQDGAAFYGNLAMGLNQFARACRPLKAHGAHWICTGHVKIAEVSDTYSGEAKSGRTQATALFTGQFRERVGAMFDIVGYTHVDREGEFLVQVKADVKHKAKLRGQKFVNVDEENIPNSWPWLMEKIGEGKEG